MLRWQLYIVVVNSALQQFDCSASSRSSFIAHTKHRTTRSSNLPDPHYCQTSTTKAIKMLTSTSSPRSSRKPAALEVMLSNLETAGDLLSGSECSSLVASPVQEDFFTFDLQSPGLRQHKRDQPSAPGPASPEPIGVLQQFLSLMKNEAYVARDFFVAEAKVECYSCIIPREETRSTRDVQQNLDDFLAMFSGYDIDVDRIFACGEDVTAFGRLAWPDCPSGHPKEVHFSVWASIDMRARIVRLRWLDQTVRLE